ncbi:MAG: hypothetical protein ACYDCL_04425 [Myxococcales bacterium]
MAMQEHWQLSLVVLALASAGCPDEQVNHTRIVRAPATSVPSLGSSAMPTPPAPAPAGQAGMAGGVPVPPRPTGADGLSWVLPQGWSEKRSGGIRYATLEPNVAGNLEASVVVLPGPAGGELANVNRWRGQLGLGPVEESQLPSLRKNLASHAGTVALYDLVSEGPQKTRLLAAIVSFSDSSWFFKVMGEDKAVSAAAPGFTHLLESLHPATAH